MKVSMASAARAVVDTVPGTAFRTTYARIRSSYPKTRALYDGDNLLTALVVGSVSVPSFRPGISANELATKLDRSGGIKALEKLMDAEVSSDFVFVVAQNAVATIMHRNDGRWDHIEHFGGEPEGTCVLINGSTLHRQYERLFEDDEANRPCRAA